MRYRLSVLDQSPIATGTTARDAIANTLALARDADALGYDRYWLAEHHGSPGLAGAAPEALIGPVAMATTRIRVGSGGIMLPHYSPFKVAETFALLSALAPGRIDLGLGRAPGSDGRTALAMQRDRSRRAPYDFPDALEELDGYLSGTLADDHPFAGLQDTIPQGGGMPELWLLGSSPDSAMLAAERGLPYCFADFINSDGAALTRHYRQAFRPSARLAAPHVMVATWTIAAPTADEARTLALPAAMMFASLVAGRQIPVPSIADAQVWAEDNPAAAAYRRRRTVLGTAGEVRRALDAVAADYQADEMMLVNILPDHAARARSYRLIAEEYGMAAMPAAA